MTTTCKTCGASLAAGQVFCSSCGTRNESLSAAPQRRFCGGCGNPLEAGAKFCNKCGTPVQVAAAKTLSSNVVASAPAPLTPTRSMATAAPTPKSGGGLLKIILFVVLLIVMLLLFAMGSCAYLAYRAKKKVDAVKQAYMDKDISKLASQLGVKNLGGKDASRTSGSGESNSENGLEGAANWKPYAGSPSRASSLSIPVKKDLVIVSATHDATRPDYETIVTVTDVSANGVNLDYTYLGPGARTAANPHPSNSSPIKSSVTQRTVLAQDLAHAHEVYLYYAHGDPNVFPGTTSIDVSKEVFNELKTNGEAPFTYQVFHAQASQMDVKSLIGKLVNDNGNLNLQDLKPSSMVPIHCTLRIATPNDIAFPLIVNDKSIEVPAMQTICKSEADELNLYILDEPENPLRLATSSRMGRMHGQTIRISFPEDKPGNPIEQELKKNRRAQVYGIYFDFASATIRPRSEPVLKEIAKAMEDNPDWKLSVEGHTDNIGSDASNLELSKRRAAAVTQALTSRYHIAGNRFTSGGLGASRPVAPNDTLEGRARNRRVELVLQ